MTISMTTASDRVRGRLWQAAIAVAATAVLAFAMPSLPAAAQASTDAPRVSAAGSDAGSVAGQAPAAKPKASAKKPLKAAPAARPAAASRTQETAQASGSRADMPVDCRGLDGVSRDVCVQCADVPIYKRVVCEQKVFWSLCKGRRLFSDAYCQQNESPGRGEGG